MLKSVMDAEAMSESTLRATEAMMADASAGPPANGEQEPSLAPPLAIPITESTSSSLEQRVRRLEDALAQLQDRHIGETRILAPPLEPRPADSPPAIPVPTQPVLASPGGPARLLWMLWDAWAEARAIVRMFVDPRYHLPWSARVPPLILLLAIVTSYYWLPGTAVPLFGLGFNKAVDLVLAFILFKWLGHEARRYRQTSPDLPPSLRL